MTWALDVKAAPRLGNWATVRQAVFDTLRRIAPEISPDELNPATPLRDQLDLDSMDWLNVLIALRDSLGVDIPVLASLRSSHACSNIEDQ